MKIQWYLRELDLPKYWPGDFLNLENRSFEYITFFSIVTFKDILDIFLLINLYISLIELEKMHLKHPLKERRGKFRIDKITYPKPSCRTTYYLSKKMSVYPQRKIQNLLLYLLRLISTYVCQLFTLIKVSLRNIKHVRWIAHIKQFTRVIHMKDKYKIAHMRGTSSFNKRLLWCTVG